VVYVRKLTLFILIVFLYIFITACGNNETIISSNPADFINSESQDVDEHSDNLTDFIEYSSLIDLDAVETDDVLDFHILDDVEYGNLNSIKIVDCPIELEILRDSLAEQVEDYMIANFLGYGFSNASVKPSESMPSHFTDIAVEIEDFIVDGHFSLDRIMTVMKYLVNEFGVNRDGLWIHSVRVNQMHVLARGFRSLSDEVDNEIWINDEIRAFSYEAHREMYAGGGAGIRFDGFYNIERNLITSKDDAVALARNEVIVDYTAISVFYDNESEMWMVLFWTHSDSHGDPVSGGCQSVYMNHDGITTLIVFGE
jgi:hypothetical protein